MVDGKRFYAGLFLLVLVVAVLELLQAQCGIIRVDRGLGFGGSSKTPPLAWWNKYGKVNPPPEMGYALLALAGGGVYVFIRRQKRRKAEGELTEEGGQVYELSYFLFLLGNGGHYSTEIYRSFQANSIGSPSNRGMALDSVASCMRVEDIKRCVRHPGLHSEHAQSLVSPSMHLSGEDRQIEHLKVIRGGDSLPSLRLSLIQDVEANSVCLLGVVTVVPAFHTHADPTDPQTVLYDLIEAADLMNNRNSCLHYWFAPGPGGYLSPTEGEQMYTALHRTVEEAFESHKAMSGNAAAT